MPFYEYRCQKCEHEFEELIRCEDDLKNLRCPQCGGEELGKLLSLFGMRTPGGKVVSSAPGGGAACAGCAKTSCAGCK